MNNPNEHPLRIIIRRFVETKFAEGYKLASYYGIEWDAPYVSIKKGDHFISLWTGTLEQFARHIDDAKKVVVMEKTRGEQYVEQTPIAYLPGAFQTRVCRKWHTEKMYTIP